MPVRALLGAWPRVLGSVRTRAGLTAALLLLVLAPAAQAARFSKPSAFPGSDARSGPSVDVNSRGDAAVAWHEGERVVVALARRGGSFSKPVAVNGSTPAGAPRVRLDDLGNIAIGWTYDDGSVVENEEEIRGAEGCCTRLAGALQPAGRRSFGAARTLSRADTHAVDADVAAGPNGGGFIWSTGYIPGDVLVVAFGGRGGTIGKTRTIARSKDYYEGLSIAFYPGGRVSLLAGLGAGPVMERIRSRSGTYLPWRRIATNEAPFFFNTRLRDARGNELLVWTSLSAGTEIATRRPGERAGRRSTLARRARGALSIAPDGSLLAARSERDGVHASARLPGGAFGPDRLVGSSRKIGYYVPAVGNRARGVVAWSVDPGRGYVRGWNGHAPGGSFRRLHLAGASSDRIHSVNAAAAASGRSLVVWAQAGRIGLVRYTP